MYRFTPVAYAETYPDARAPVFTSDDRDIISDWSRDSVARDMRVEFFSELYGIFDEALLVASHSNGDRLWLIHKTPAGGVAVRPWPGDAVIVATMADALALVRAWAREDCPGPTPGLFAGPLPVQGARRRRTGAR